MPLERNGPADSAQHDPLLLRAAALEFIISRGGPLTAKSLEYMAVRGTGPKFRIMNGRAVYKRSDLEAWLNGDERAAGAA